jgi:hypothetical protein
MSSTVFLLIFSIAFAFQGWRMLRGRATAHAEAAGAGARTGEPMAGPAQPSMGIFAGLFQQTPAVADKDPEAWTTGADFLGATTLMQFLPDRRFDLSRETFDMITEDVVPEARDLVELWCTFYLTWLMTYAARQAYGAEFRQDTMTAMYAWITINADLIADAQMIADAIEFWFKHMDAAAVDAANAEAKGPVRPLVRFVARRFLAFDASSPYFGKAEEITDDVVLTIATALEAAYTSARPFIETTVRKAGSLGVPPTPAADESAADEASPAGGWDRLAVSRK